MNDVKPVNITIDIKATLISLIDNTKKNSYWNSSERLDSYSITLSNIKTILENIKEV